MMIDHTASGSMGWTYSLGSYSMGQTQTAKSRLSTESFAHQLSLASTFQSTIKKTFASATEEDHVFSKQSSELMSIQLDTFKRTREGERMLQYEQVLFRTGKALILVCAFDIGLNLILYLWNLRTHAAIIALRCLGAACTTIFLISLAFFAVILVDFNALMKSHMRLRCWCLLCLLMCTFCQSVEAPYIGLIGSFASLPLAFYLRGDQTFASILCVWLLDAVAEFAYVGVVLEQFGSVYSILWLCCAAFAGFVSMAWFLWHLCLRLPHDQVDGRSSSHELYSLVVQYTFIMGLTCLAFSALLLYDTRQGNVGVRKRAYAGALSLFIPSFLHCLGLKRLRLRAAVRFGLLDQLSKERDGAFLASLMDVTMIEVGKWWWVHRAPGAEDEDYKETDHRRSWMLGKIVEVEADYFTVLAGHVLYMQSAARRNVSSEDILSLARATLRCLDWQHFSIDVLRGDRVDRAGLTSSTFVSHARPLREDEERIDFFISHSWHDDAELKYAQLQVIADAFFHRHGREPTFWLDHVCIDQNQILDGLRTLPVNILACNQVIVLCGKTYLSRLWCAWEMCTRMSFDPPEVAQSSIMVRPLGDLSSCELDASFKQFDIMKARCYDPNEEARVLSVVRALGPNRFNNVVKQIGSARPWLNKSDFDTMISLESLSPRRKSTSSSVGSQQDVSSEIASEVCSMFSV
eukprot:TRINITY_DN23740_c0_g5_i1.p1 TRINITY_DN23740_c0_g5~~TRINITY_DN23740_c0_g5_i1.p1  ORF type:complete len:690 (-),score=60.36 TRINITY_DN23740_c0_g5_i1:294-2363(-)